MPWANARVAHLLSVCRMMAVEVGDGIAEESSSDDCDQVMFTQNVETIEAFSSCMVLVKAGMAYTGECINIMVQALWTKDGSLLQGLTVQSTYIELSQGGKKAVMVVRNSTAHPQTLWRKTPVARAVAVLPVPEPPKRVSCRIRVTSPKILIPPNWLSGKGMETIWWTGSEWVRFLASRAGRHCLSAPGWVPQHVFVGPMELGCTHSTKHRIKVTDDTPFKEWFRQIPLPLVEEVWNHLWEMLESGAIRPI